MLKAICVRREFNVWARDRSSPIVDWLRALARKAHAECGGKGVGAVGMCFTGSFALAMMTEPAVVAPVLSQPSLPLRSRRDEAPADIDVSPDEIACAKRRFKDEDLSMIGLRFLGDPFVPDERFDDAEGAIRRPLRGHRTRPEGRAHRTRACRPHSVLTLHLVDDGPTKAAEQRVIEFFRERTGAA